MCGIVGYVGRREATPIVIEGLRRLEYRGYDSAGVAILQSDCEAERGKRFTIQVRRDAGKLLNLERAVREAPTSGTIGIGHTRWATHGKPSERNAHPHRDCTGEIVVIQNGIVENYVPLKQRLLAQGHRFASETDTEVIVHLVEHYYFGGAHARAAPARPVRPFPEAVRLALQELEGAHAIVVLTAREPGTLVAARLGHAGGVAIGYGEGEMFVASDVPAVLEHTRRFVFLGNRELAVVTAGGASYLHLDGRSLDVEKAGQVQTITWDAQAAAKGGYKHFMLKEIYEQPRTLTDTLRGRLRLDPPGVRFEELEGTLAGESDAGAFRLTDEVLRRFDRCLLVACGTAWHAGLVGKFLIENLARLPVEVDYADEFRYRDPVIDERTLVIPITQSGETVDVLVSMEEAKRRGATLLGIVNVVGSAASREAHGVIYTHCGPEIGVASTKAFTSQLAALAMLAIRLGLARGTLAEGTVRELVQDLSRLPELIGSLLDEGAEARYQRLAARYYQRNDFLYLGRGINYPIALEGALKLKEISYIHAEGYPAGEMKHGPIALIEAGFPVVAIAVQDRVYDKMLSQIEQVRARDGSVIALATVGDELIESKADDVIWLPRVHDLLMPVLTAIPMQLIAYHIGVRRGCDVDQPRNLAKSVTVE